MLQESDRGAIHKVSNYPNLLLEVLIYCCPVEISRDMIEI